MSDSDRTRRVGTGVLVGLALIVAVVLAVSLARGGDNAPDAKTYQVDAIFDAARGIGPRQVVKIAGARVGEVKAVHLTRDFKARIVMKIDKRFAPFRADASCAIKPEGLISENFVSCSPGTADASPLRDDASGTPTVPVQNTMAPVSLQDLFQIFNMPTTQRLSVLLDELGMSVAGRGSDLNSILYRANPTLAAARKAITVVNRQRAQLVQLLDASAPVIGRLAQRNADVKRFIEQTARLTTTTANHRDALGESIKRLPPLLRAAEPALRELSDVAEAAPPTLRNLRIAAPSLQKATTDVTPLSRSGVSALDALDKPLTDTRTALRRGTPVVKLLSTFAADADPAGQALVRFLFSLRDTGFAENLLRLIYGAAGATNHFDSESHLLTFQGAINACSLYARSPVGGCDGRLDGKSSDDPATSSTRAEKSTPKTSNGGHAPARTTPAGTTPSAASPAPSTSTTPSATQTPTGPLPLNPTPPTVTTPAPPSGGGDDNSVKKILDYLLK